MNLSSFRGQIVTADGSSCQGSRQILFSFVTGSFGVWRIVRSFFNPNQNIRLNSKWMHHCPSACFLTAQLSVLTDPPRCVRVCSHGNWRRDEIADKRSKLCPLQDLWHKGPEPEHQLGGPWRRRRTSLQRDVNVRLSLHMPSWMKTLKCCSIGATALACKCACIWTWKCELLQQAE